jgi:hypothetical protein
LFRGKGFVLEAQRAIGQGTKAAAVEFINRAGEDQMLVAPASAGFVRIDPEVQFHSGRGIEHFFE